MRLIRLENLKRILKEWERALTNQEKYLERSAIYFFFQKMSETMPRICKKMTKICKKFDKNKI